MARINQKIQKIQTHEGAPAKHINPELRLRRSLMACMLWEKEFYEDGESIAERIRQAAGEVPATKIADIAIEARMKMKLRHAPLWLTRELARMGPPAPIVSGTLAAIIQRPDELCEFLSMYWKEGKCPLSAQVKKGLAAAFQKFSEYQLQKYNNQDRAIKLRDVLFLCHAKPKDSAQDAMWKRLIAGELATPDTWEVGLSACKTDKEKREVWHRLLSENKLGALALLRNLRNMERTGVGQDLIRSALSGMNTGRVLPFRFIAAARHAVDLEPELEAAMFRAIDGHKKLPGKTALLIDVSGSMDWQISQKSEMTRMDAACGLAVLAREVCENVAVFSFSDKTIMVPPRRGFALRDAIVTSQEHGGTYLGRAVTEALRGRDFSRIIVFTDEQSHDYVPDPSVRGYMINVASAQNGVGYGAWTHIDGFSEAVMDYIIQSEE